MSLFIGLSGLQTSQVGLNVISQNITNANTPGFSRQNVLLEAQNGGFFQGAPLGSGVQVNQIERVRSSVIESFLTESISDFQRANSIVTTQRQIENFFLPGDGSIQNSLQSLFNDVAALAGAPSDPTARSQAVQSGTQLADQFREISQNLRTIQDSLLVQIRSEVANLNNEFQQLDQLNQDINTNTIVSGIPPNGLLDTRDLLINSIAERIDVSRLNTGDDGSINLIFGNTSIQALSTNFEVEVRVSQNQINLGLSDRDGDLSLNSGRISGLLDAYNNIIPGYQAQLDELAQSLIANFDAVHATGVGLEGSFTSLVGSRSLISSTTPLEDVSTAFPIRNGDLSISVIDPDGNRTTETITIDPEAQNLNDVVALISSIDNLNAAINPQTGQIQLNASAGYQFDFTGTTATSPNLTSFTGTAIPSFSGIFTGDNNQTLNFEVVGSGNVGVANDLSLNVRDAAGNLLETVNIGVGYEAGTPIDLGDGVSISLPGGTVADGDAFDIQLVSEPDETGLLVALGINSFFNGSDATTIEVDAAIVDDPSRFATSQTGETAESNQVNDFIQLSESRVLGGNRLTFDEFLIEITTEIGVDVQTSTSLATSLESLQEQYQLERDSFSGVDVNEELVRLTQFQRSFEAAVRVIQTQEAIFDELFTILR